MDPAALTFLFLRPQLDVLRALAASADTDTAAKPFLLEIIQWKGGTRLMKFTQRIVKQLGLSVYAQEDVEQVWEFTLPPKVPGFGENPGSRRILMECSACGESTSFPWEFSGHLVIPSTFNSATGFGPRFAAELLGNHTAAVKNALLCNENAFFLAYNTHACGPAALTFTANFTFPEVVKVSTLTGWVDPAGERAPAPGTGNPLQMTAVEPTLSTSQLLPGVPYGDTPNELLLSLRSIVLRIGETATQGHFINYLLDNAGE